MAIKAGQILRNTNGEIRYENLFPGAPALIYKYDQRDDPPYMLRGVAVEGIYGLWREESAFAIARSIVIEKALLHELYSVLECPCTECQETATVLEASYG